MLQSILDAIDAQINKTRSPLVNVLIATPIFLIISMPLAMVVAVLVIIATGSDANVQQTSTMPGIIAGVLTILIFWAWASYGTYRSNAELQENGSLTNE